MDKLYSYYLHWNPYTEKWNAVPRDKASEYLNGMLTDKEVLKDKDLDVLIEKIIKNEKKE